MNLVVLFFIFGAAIAEPFFTGVETEGLRYGRGFEVPVVEQVVGVQNVGVTNGRTSQVGNVGVTGRTDIPIVGQVSEGVVGTQYPVGNTEMYGRGRILSGIVPESGVEYPVLRNGVEKIVQKVPAYGQVQTPILRDFPHYDYHQTYPIVKNVQYLDKNIKQDVYRNIPLHHKLSQLLRAFPYLYNRQYPVEPELVKTGLQYPMGEKLEQEIFRGVQTPYLKNIRQGYPLVYNREYTGVRDEEMSENVRPIFRDIPVTKYEPYKFYGKQYNPIYRAFPYLYPQEYTTHFDKTYGKFPVTHSYKPYYSQDYFNSRFLDQDVFNRHVQEYPVYNKEFKYSPYFPLNKHESPIYKHEYPVYKHEYPIYEKNHVYMKYPQVYQPIEQSEELPFGYDYEVPFRTGYPVHETHGKTVSTSY